MRFLKRHSRCRSDDDVAVVGELIESAVVISASPKADGHSPNAKLVVTITEVCP